MICKALSHKGDVNHGTVTVMHCTSNLVHFMVMCISVQVRLVFMHLHAVSK